MKLEAVGVRRDVGRDEKQSSLPGLISDGLQNWTRLLELQQEFYMSFKSRLWDFKHQVSAFSASLSGGSSPAKSFLINTYNLKEGNWNSKGWVWDH